MMAVGMDRFGGPEVMVVRETPVPDVGEDDVLIAVAAAGVNRPDVMQRSGNYPPPPGASTILGLEVSGTVVGAGRNVTWPRIGDVVCALVAGGGYAQYVTAAAAVCLPIPAGFTLVEAAAIPETFFTVWSNVFERARLRPNESLLVHGGASGIGTTAIALARALGCRVFATVGSAAKRAVAERLGAERAIEYHSEDFVEIVKGLTAGVGVDVVLDIVGGSYVSRNLDVLAPDGRLVQIGILESPHAEVNVYTIMRKRLTVTGSTLRPRSVAFKAKIARALREHVWLLFEAGIVKPLVDRTLPLAEVVEAHLLMEANEINGKIVLTV